MVNTDAYILVRILLFGLVLTTCFFFFYILLNFAWWVGRLMPVFAVRLYHYQSAQVHLLDYTYPGVFVIHPCNLTSPLLKASAKKSRLFQWFTIVKHCHCSSMVLGETVCPLISLHPIPGYNSTLPLPGDYWSCMCFGALSFWHLCSC